MPAVKGGADASEAEAGLTEAQIRARNAARKYRESQDREMARKRRSGSVWMAVALINAVRYVPRLPLHSPLRPASVWTWSRPRSCR